MRGKASYYVDLTLSPIPQTIMNSGEKKGKDEEHKRKGRKKVRFYIEALLF
jgi:hypothetical protein